MQGFQPCADSQKAIAFFEPVNSNVMHHKHKEIKMQIINGIVYGGMFAVVAHFLFTLNTVANLSSETTRKLIKIAILLLAIVPISAGFMSGVFKVGAGTSLGAYISYGAIVSSIAGLFLLTRGLQHAIGEAYARNPHDSENA